MTTTLDIETDVFAAAEKLARAEGTSTGKALSDLARRGLQAQVEKGNLEWHSGVPVFPSRGVAVTNEDIQRIRDAENI